MGGVSLVRVFDVTLQIQLSSCGFWGELQSKFRGTGLFFTQAIGKSTSKPGFTPPSCSWPGCGAYPRREHYSTRAVLSCIRSIIQADLHQSQFRPQLPAGVFPEFHSFGVVGKDEDIAFLDASLAKLRQTGLDQLPSDAA